jgi:PRC-barrel domain protein
MDDGSVENEHLRYLDASHVESPVGVLGDMVLRGPTDEKVGTLDGVIIDPVKRRVCYLVVASGAWFKRRRYLVPMGPAKVEPDGHALRVEVDSRSIKECPAFHSDAYPQFSDADLITNSC